MRLLAKRADVAHGFTMPTKNRYLAVLKTKQGEMLALETLSSRVWGEFNPLFELLGDSRESSDDTESSLKETTKQLLDSSREGVLIFVDFDNYGSAKAGSDAPPKILKDLESAGRHPMPVVSLSTPTVVLESLRERVMASRSACVRIYMDEMGKEAPSRINDLMESLKLDPKHSHFVFDIEHVGPQQIGSLTVALPHVLSSVPYLNEWETFTLAGTGYPETLEISAGSSALIPRNEWKLWKELHEDLSSRVRRLDFGDYAVTHPVLVDFDGKIMSVSPKIVYTIEDAWIAYKGYSSQRKDFSEQTPGMCKALAARAEFEGVHFSDGDDFIVRCASGSAGPGNSASWKRVGTNHHVTFVAHQLANYPLP